MNVAKVITALKATRKLLPVSVYHQHVEPSIQLNKIDFDTFVPFLKVLFKAFDRNGFTLHISRWGEIYLHSVARGVGVPLKLKELITLPLKESLRKLESQGYQILELQPSNKCFVIEYHFAKTKTIWRALTVNPNLTDPTIVEDSVLLPILDMSRQFQGRVKDVTEDIIERILTIDDICAIAQFGNKCQPNLRAINGIHAAFSNHYLKNFRLIETGITFDTFGPSKELSFYWHKNDIKFLTKYYPEIFDT